MSQFISLHNHSSFSILQALPSPKELMLRAKELGQSAISITDNGTFAGTWQAFKASKETGIKLIIGAEFNFLNNREDRIRHIILLAKNAEGYRNLLTLNKKGFDEPIIAGRKVIPVINWALLKEHSNGVLCLTGCGNGIISQSINGKNFPAAENDLNRLLEIFTKDNLAIEIQTHRLTRQANQYYSGIEQTFTNYQLIQLAKKFGIKVIPTCGTRYLTKEQAETHDVLLAIGSMQPIYSNARLKYNTTDLYLKSYDEVVAFFSRNFGEDFAKEICQNSVDFANKCEEPKWIDPKFSNKSKTGQELPKFPVKDEKDYEQFSVWWKNQDDKIKGLEEDQAYLRYKCYNIFDEKEKDIPLEKRSEYRERMEKELYVLEHQGFSSYMLIVADFIFWARNNGVLVGEGRGSCGGSLLGYLLRIHSADPIKYGLIFERFQNIERTNFPDIDTDLNTNGREKVIDYLDNKYGNNMTAYISNLNLFKPKMFVRDISRSYQLGGSTKEAVQIGNNLAEVIPTNLKDTINFSNLQKSPLFMEYCKKYPELVKNKKILGQIRNSATHAAARILGMRSLVGLVPLRKDKDGNQSLEYNKDDAEESGLLKMDLLGLSTLDFIDDTLKLINNKEHKLSLEDIKFEEYDKKTYDLITSGDTFGVFQLGTSGGTIELCKKVKPMSIEDLAIVTTLARPAAANIREDFIKTRAGKKPFKLLHPSLRNAFEKTYGYGLYDESILQLGSDVAGWNLNEADRLRKMIKNKGKYPEKEKQLRQEFIEDAYKNNDIKEQIGAEIWDKEVSSFGSYTFNKSHAVLYSFISFITAYLKAHYPIEFLLALLIQEIRSNAPNAEINRAKAKQELRNHKVKILPPNLNTSQMHYHLIDKNTLLTGIDALKFVGDDAITDILEKRPFKDFDDFMLRCETKKVRSSAIQALAASGSLDSFNIPRRSIFLYVQEYRKKLQVWLKKHDPAIDHFTFAFPDEPEWTKPELFALEKHYLGEAFICSKKEAFGNFFNNNKITFPDLKKYPDKTFLPQVKAEIKDMFEFKIKKEKSKFLGKDMAKALIEDENGNQISLTIFPTQWEEIKKRIRKEGKAFEAGYAVHFSGSCNLYENEMGIILDNLYQIVPPPPLPKDLKAKKLIKKKEENNLIPEQPTKPSELFQDLENELFSEGLLDSSENDDPFFIDI